MTSDEYGRTAFRSVCASGLAALVLLELGTAVTAALSAGWSVATAIDAFVVTNVVIGLSCVTAGFLIAWQRPRNPVGWLLLGAGVSQSGTAAAAPLTDLAAGAGEPVLRTLATVTASAWPWSIGLFLPLTLLLFPDGRLPGPRWRPVPWLIAISGTLFAVNLGTEPAAAGMSQPWLALAGHAGLAPLWTVSELLNLATYLAAVAALVVRYRRGDEQRRRQLLWLVLALVLVTVVLVPWGLFDAGPVLQLLAIALVPGAITVAVLRHRLLDIRLVLSRTVLYVLLTALVAAGYLALVTLANAVLARPDGILPGSLGNAVLAALVVAIAFEPVRARLQRLVDRALYGDRSDPVRALAGMGQRLRTGDAADVPTAICDALRLPYAAVVRDGEVRSEHGVRPDTVEQVPLVYRGEPVGELVLGVRAGQRGLDRTDRSACAALAAPLAVAVRATDLADSLQRSRERIVTAREEERRRIRRDLHDGLGPALTGISFQADAAGNLLGTDPDAASAQLTALRAAATEAIADIRRLVHDLRPPTLDELGLVEALRRHVAQLGPGPPAVRVTAVGEIGTLPAAVEVAAYRIATEAVTNAVRHSGAARVEVHVDVDAAGDLGIEVRDDGAGAASWTPGVGTSSMAERAAELGGAVAVDLDGDGGRVRARLPLGRSADPDAATSDPQPAAPAAVRS